MNKFEPEFMPSKTNGFKKIMDETLTGPEKYSYLFPKECTVWDNFINVMYISAWFSFH